MKTLQGTERKASQYLLIMLVVGALALPPLVVATSGTATVSATWTALRIFALYALTVVFVNVITGSFRPLLAAVFKPKLLFTVHNTTGIVGLSLALAHMVLVIVYGLWPGFEKLGPVALYILAATTFTVLLRKYLVRSWRIIHRLNYVVFVVAWIHAFQVGTDLMNGTFLKVVLYLYLALVAVGFVYRLWLAIRAELKKRPGGE